MWTDLAMWQSKPFSTSKINQPSNNHSFANTTQNWAKLPPKEAQVEYLSNDMQIKQFEKYRVQKCSELCTLVHGSCEKMLRKRQKLMSFLVRFWDKEPSSLTSHVVTYFSIKSFLLSTFHIWKLHRFHMNYVLRPVCDPPHMHLWPL